MANVPFAPMPRCWRARARHRPERPLRRPSRVNSESAQRQVLFALAVAGALAAVAAITLGPPATLF